MKLIAALILATATTFAVAAEEKNVKVDGKTYEVRVPKSAKIDCKDAKNADKTECKKQPKEMPKIEKPVVKAPKDEPKKK
jgi:hypothetical protein